MDGEQEDIDELSSMRQVKELFAQMKNIYRKLEYDAKNISTNMDNVGIDTTTGQSAKELERRKTMLQKDGMGDLDEIGEFGLGVAPRFAKPVTKIELSKAKEEEIAKMQVDDDDYEGDYGMVGNPDDDDESKMEIIRLKKQREKKRKPVDRQTAFIEFKSLAEGQQFED